MPVFNGDPSGAPASATVTGYWFGDSGKFCTKAEQEAAAERARIESERMAIADAELGR